MDVEKVFKIGDVVQLPSGGPFMTVSKITPGAIDCAWFDLQFHLHTGQFSRFILVRKLVS
jgi:uncharacterized protein YodC (DUF2158 family)